MSQKTRRQLTTSAPPKVAIITTTTVGIIGNIHNLPPDSMFAHEWSTTPSIISIFIKPSLYNPTINEKTD